MERWLPIDGWEGFYEVSDLGNVRSLGRVIKDKNDKKLRLYGRVLKFGIQRGGYHHVVLHGNGIKKISKVHYLVLSSFLGPRPDGSDIAHNDGDPSNNKLVNLRYCSRSENEMDKVKHKTSNRGERHGMSKLTSDQVKSIREESHYTKTTNLARKYGVCTKTIINILTRKIWRHV